MGAGSTELSYRHQLLLVSEVVAVRNGYEH